MNEFDLIILSAFRYVLGRMTYIVKVVAKYIMNKSDKLNSNAIKIIIREINEANECNGLGMECDKKSWLCLKEYLENELILRGE